jgi:cytokinin dehydrogenase
LSGSEPELFEGGFESRELDTAPATLSRVETDFGRLATGRALGVARPSSVNELARMVQKARSTATSVAIRGAGSSQSGQCLPDQGVVLDMSGWTRIHGVDRERQTVTCEPGVTWRSLLSKTIPLGLVPKVHPLNLDLTVAGTLSAGGLGSTSHHHGFAVSHVSSADVVLGTGELVTTGPERERDVFDSVLGGVGRVGVIACVELALARAPRGVETVVLRYEQLGDLCRDLTALSNQPSVLHAAAMCSASVHGLAKSPNGRREPLRHWSFALELSCAAEDGGAELDSQLARLSPSQVMHRESDELESFLARYDIRFEMMRATGAWQMTHPWFEALVPLKEAENAMQRLMQLPALFGDGHRLSMVADSNRPTSVAFPGVGPVAAIAVLPVGIPAALAPVALNVLSGLDAYIYGVGGRRYLSGWLTRNGEFNWKRHYGDDYARLVELKRRYDPMDLFRSRLEPLEGARQPGPQDGKMTRA